MSDYCMRTLLPALLSFVIAVLIGPKVIEILRKLKAGQTEREEGLESHQKKTGTPTMGGVIFLLPVVVIGIFYGASHKEVIPVLILTIGFGIIGFIDDYI
ncbi:MAG: phospho-N-acetylmuramoyl-pentapeptide-transferase, partial [Butyrivibrio sp.]|nr:phospho-N-acetylmuramoyl-pentapeptide-transferase [Butyrivibrio sp.]